MSGKIIVFCVIVLILILVAYLFHDSEMMSEMKQSGKAVVKKVENAKEGRDIEITNGPIIQIKNPGEKGYHSVTVTKKEFKIGRNKNCDLTLDFKAVEDKHAIIIKRLKGDRVFFEFINYAKINPSEFFNKQKNKYEYLGYKDGVELEAREAFYVGDTKILITIPQSSHIPTDTERIENFGVAKRVEDQVDCTDSSTRVFCKETDI